MISARFVAFCLVSALLPVQARVVINEILYHPPDGFEAVEFVELYNSADQSVDLSGWKFTKGLQYQFDQKTQIASKGFLVVARDKEEFKKAYGFEPGGVFKDSLKHKGEKLELSDATGKKIDSVKFKDSAPWPLSPDGGSATLERISPAGKSNDPHNWAPGPLGADASKPGGTPGKQNAAYSAAVPPVITDVTFTSRVPRPNDEVKVSATITNEVDSVRLYYRVAGAGSEKPEQSISMTAAENRHFTASIPRQPENSIVRFRIEAVGRNKALRVEPSPFELQPAFSYFVHDKFNVGKIPWGLLVFVDEADFKKEEERPRQQGPGMMQGDPNAFMARMMFETTTDLAPIWADLCLTQGLSHAQVTKARDALRGEIEQREKNLASLQKNPPPPEPMKQAQAWVKAFHENSRSALVPVLNDAQRQSFNNWESSKTNTTPGRPPNFTPEMMLQRVCNVEGGLLYLSTRAKLSDSEFEKLKTISARAMSDRDKFIERVRKAMQERSDSDDLISDVQNLRDRVGNDQAEVVSDEAVRKDFKAWLESTNPFRGPGGPADSNTPDPARGKNAFVFVSPETGEPELYDFIRANARSGGYKVHFPKNHTLRGMTGINLIFEYKERFVLAEPLAYEVYRQAGNAAEQTDFVRLFVDGRPVAYHLLCEQPNRAFLKRNKLRDDGNMYKILWYERGVVRQHEKKTNLHTGHDDVLQLVDALEKTKGDEQWAVIKKNFNVDQVATYFAVNMVLSHWDGFFNNYFAYHDLHGTGKWEMYPWDQDKTWGFYDSLPEGQVFFDMPLTFGMEGDRPPGYPKDKAPPRGFGMDWWRPGGYFSKPLLANPQFRAIFLARTRDVLEHVYTQEIFFPVIDQLRDRLRDEIPIRADVLKQTPAEAQAQFERDLSSLKEHLTKRREFLLAQDEIKNAGKFEPGKFQ